MSKKWSRQNPKKKTKKQKSSMSRPRQYAPLPSQGGGHGCGGPVFYATAHFLGFLTFGYLDYHNICLAFILLALSHAPSIIYQTFSIRDLKKKKWRSSKVHWLSGIDWKTVNQALTIRGFFSYSITRIRLDFIITGEKVVNREVIWYIALHTWLN